MKVTLLNYARTVSDMEAEYLARQAAAICVDKLDNPTKKGMIIALDSGHLSILEHLPLTWVVEDVSRALTHQLVRHRMASYTQQSQRYAKVNTQGEKWFITPMSITTNRVNGEYTLDKKYQELMVHIAEVYNEICEAGIPNEDARMILPNACFTSIMVSMNARSFSEAATLRTCNRAQWEIRQMFQLMRDSIKDIYPNVWKKCFPNCTKKCGCLEVKPCGNPYEKFSSNK